MLRTFGFLLFVVVNVGRAQRIAVIGGGISGTFVTKYLADYDKDCSLETLKIFDPYPLGRFITKETENIPSAQGSRVGTYQMDDGRIIEIGASIMTDSFSYIIEMAKGGNLTLGPPFATGKPEETKRNGMVIYNGNGDIALNTANVTNSYGKKYDLLWRYNLDLLYIARATNNAIERFHDLQEHLRDEDNYYYNSPKEMWEAVNLQSLIDMSLDEYCDKIWVPDYVQWWRSFLRGQGSLRKELLASINLVNYNQDLSEINALTGLASFSVSSTPFYSIAGGNVQLVSTAFEQAKATLRTKCPDKSNVISHVPQRVSTVVGSLNGFEVYDSEGSLLGEFDQVILAVPLAMAKVDFLIKSNWDESVLQPMPLGGLIENKEDDTRVPDGHEGHISLPRRLPKAVTRSYTQVVTTIVRNADLQLDYFSIDPNHIPRGIYMTPKGKALEYNVTSIAQISSEDDVYKVFSSQPLTRNILESFFGSKVVVEYEKTWGGPHGGATPQYRGKGESTDFLLYDGATGFQGHTKAGALYYPNALELTFACIELSAMGAKAVAKLIAKRLDWIEPDKEGYGMGEEL